MREFKTGATRDSDEGKLDYEGFLSPLVLQRFAQYMHKHRHIDGGMMESDNWQRGIPVTVYMKSLLRHVVELWIMHRCQEPIIKREEVLCAIMFNTMGYLHECWCRCADDFEVNVDDCDCR